jgi:hypothetical protein
VLNDFLLAGRLCLGVFVRSFPVFLARAIARPPHDEEEPNDEYKNRDVLLAPK